MEAQGELDNLFQSGNVNKAMQMAFAMLSANKDTKDAQSVSSLDLTIPKYLKLNQLSEVFNGSKDRLAWSISILNGHTSLSHPQT